MAIYDIIFFHALFIVHIPMFTVIDSYSSSPISSVIQLTQIRFMYSIIIVYTLPFRVASMPVVRFDLNGGFPNVPMIWFIIYQEDMVTSVFVIYISLIGYLHLFKLNTFCLRVNTIQIQKHGTSVLSSNIAPMSTGYLVRVDAVTPLLNWACCHVTPLYQVYIHNKDVLQGWLWLVVLTVFCAMDWSHPAFPCWSILLYIRCTSISHRLSPYRGMPIQKSSILLRMLLLWVRFYF